METSSRHVRIVLGILLQEFQKGDIVDLKTIYTVCLGKINSSKLRRLYPNNHNLDAKVRQSLQILRENGHIRFINNNGTYEIQ